MATLSKNTKLEYQVGAGAFVLIPDITSIPSLGGAPTSHDVTDLEDTEHIYIKGLQDNGGAFEFAANMTNAFITAVKTAVTAQASAVLTWKVTFPLPTNVTFSFTGECSLPYNDAVEVDAPLTGMFTVVPTGAITIA